MIARPLRRALSALAAFTAGAVGAAPPALVGVLRCSHVSYAALRVPGRPAAWVPVGGCFGDYAVVDADAAAGVAVLAAAGERIVVRLPSAPVGSGPTAPLALDGTTRAQQKLVRAACQLLFDTGAQAVSGADVARCAGVAVEANTGVLFRLTSDGGVLRVDMTGAVHPTGPAPVHILVPATMTLAQAALRLRVAPGMLERLNPGYDPAGGAPHTLRIH